MNENLQQQRDRVAEEYFSQLRYSLYPVQEEALLAWFTASQGVLVSAPTGTGKTLIAEAAVFEALRLGKAAYYTTPLIALTDQKFRELSRAAVEWGYSADDIGLVTGNRKVNPQARIQVVVAEILLNRLLHPAAFDLTDTWAVIMDEFHSFNDPERGIVWEFSLELLPKSVRTLLLSATIGNAYPFARWLETQHGRELALVQSDDRKVPLSFHWIEDQLLDEQIETMVTSDPETTRVPALVFCFNREQCWSVAELLKGRKVVLPAQQKQLANRLDDFDWSLGAGPKLRQILQRGVGVHHAGVLPRYRRAVEQLFQEKLLSVCVCTETLAAGINLPARSVVIPSLVKGPPDKMRLIDPSSAHQMFGRAGRPQFDHQGYVYALAHEDDVKLLRWKAKFDQIPADTKDPSLIRAKKQLKKKMPKRREGVTYWNQSQFESLVKSKPVNLSSRGPLPWRLLAYMLDLSPEVAPIRRLVANRLLPESHQKRAQLQLDQMLITLSRADYVRLEPPPPKVANPGDGTRYSAVGQSKPAMDPISPGDASNSVRPLLDLGQRQVKRHDPTVKLKPGADDKANSAPLEEPTYQAVRAVPTERLADLAKLRGVHPLFGMFLLKHLGIADRTERLLAMESLLELPKSLGPSIRVPRTDQLPDGPLAESRLNPALLTMGLATAAEIGGRDADDEAEQDRGRFPADFVPVLTLADKLLRLFQHEFPEVHDLRIWPVWVAGELLNFNGDFQKYITSYKLQKQEGLILRHLLRLILLIDEFAMLVPEETTPEEWQDDLGSIADALEAICRGVDPDSTTQWLDEAKELRAGL